MKKSKTINEYLQSECNQLERKREMARLEGRTPISYEDGLRIIFNNLFPQIGISGRFGPEDTPIEALARLLDEADDDKQREHLKACLGWVNEEFHATLAANELSPKRRATNSCWPRSSRDFLRKLPSWSRGSASGCAGCCLVNANPLVALSASCSTC